MSTRPQNAPVSLVSREDIEKLLGDTRDATSDANAGIFGPQSITWKINRESALFLGAGRAALLQLAHPWVATALAQHSTTLSNPIDRFHQTFRVIYTMIFGTRSQALAASRQLYARHTGIQGQMPEHVAAYSAGSHYRANEIHALRWVYATLVESAVLAYDFALPPLTCEERETYYGESKKMAALFGIPESALPGDWNAFTDYSRQMWDSDALGVNEISRSMAHRLLQGAGSWIKPPHWYRALTASWMPDRFTRNFALDFGPKEKRALMRARRWFPLAYTTLPKIGRWVGPYHEACARLERRPEIGWLTQTSNRFWMGQPRLMFSGSSNQDGLPGKTDPS